MVPALGPSVLDKLIIHLQMNSFHIIRHYCFSSRPSLAVLHTHLLYLADLTLSQPPSMVPCRSLPYLAILYGPLHSPAVPSPARCHTHRWPPCTYTAPEGQECCGNVRRVEEGISEELLLNVFHPVMGHPPVIGHRSKFLYKSNKSNFSTTFYF